MKRVFVALLIIALVTGIALPAVLRNRVFTASMQNGAAGNSLPHLQMNVISIPEPASIVLSSLVLLGSITLLRRHRLTRRA